MNKLILTIFLENKFISQSKLCSTLSGLEVPLLTITDPESEIQAKDKKIVLVTG